MARKNTSDQDQLGALRQQVDSLSQRGAALAGDAGRKASEAAATGARMDLLRAESGANARSAGLGPLRAADARAVLFAIS